MTEVGDEVRTVIGAVLDREHWSGEPLRPSDEQWSLLCSRMFAGKIPGVLADAVGAGQVVIDEPVRSKLFDQMVVRLVNDLRAESESVRVTGLLDAEGIESLVLKGLAVAHLDHADPSLRSTTDVDLLVRPDDIEQATAVLTDNGYRRDLPERRSGFDRRFAKDVTMYGPRRVEIDLHRTLLRGPFGAAIDLDELWANQEALDVTGLPVRRALDKPSRLLHASYTVAVADEHPSLANLCDVAVLAIAPDLDWDAVRCRASRWRADGIVVDAVAMAARATGLPLEAPIERVDDPLATRWRGLYTSGGGSLVATTMGMALALGPRRSLRYLRDLALPSAEYRRARRQAGRRSERKAAVDTVRRRLGRSGT